MQIICPLVGAHFRPQEAKDVLRGLQVYDRLKLVRDPHNEYDNFAVKVVDFETGAHLGFIPKGDNYELSLALDAGEEISAEIIGFENALRPTLEINFDDA